MTSLTKRPLTTLLAGGKAAMWVDATVAGGILENPKQSQVVGKVGYAPAPVAVTPNGSHWLWSWAFAIPAKAKNMKGAKQFVEWATSKEYIKLAADDLGWASVPPGTRKSTYENLEYQKAAPFAKATLKAMETADPTNPVPLRIITSTACHLKSSACGWCVFFCFHQVLFVLISRVRHKSGQVPPPDHRSNRRSKRCLTPAHSSFKML
jgi:ABC-type glycerol-3-phosphate transport system substrate-binding protein